MSAAISERNLESEALGLSSEPQQVSHVLHNYRGPKLHFLDAESSGLDLGKVQDVIDDGQKGEGVLGTNQDG